MEFEKRVARARTILDFDDYHILDFLIRKKREVSLNEIKEKMNLSHNALLVHLNRLENYEWIEVLRDKGDYKFKNVNIISDGKELMKILSKPMIKKSKKLKDYLAKSSEKRKRKTNKSPSEQFISKLKKSRISNKPSK